MSEPKWLTRKEIQDAAEASDLAAIRTSLQHWEQIGSVTKQEYLDAAERGMVSMSQDFCSLCLRYEGLTSCYGCPIVETTESCFCPTSIYAHTFADVNASQPNERLTRATLTMREYLMELYTNEYKKQEVSKDEYS